MPNLQEYLDKKYPTKELREKVTALYFTYLSPQKISVAKINEKKGWLTVYLNEEQQKEIEGGELNLSEYVNLTDIRIDGNYLKTPLTKLDISSCFNLVILICINNNLISANFLKQLPNPKKIEILNVYNNNIQPTDIELFSRFVNVRVLKIGTEKEAFKNGKHNKFYGSFKSYQDLTKLERICIEATDIDKGLEFLPMSLAKSTAKRANEDKEGGGYLYFECSPHDINNKCSRIKEHLKPFDYDLEAWQLTGFCEALLAAIKSEFSNWEGVLIILIGMLDEKIIKTRNELELVELHKVNKIDKIKRLESKLQKLTQIKDKIQKRI